MSSGLYSHTTRSIGTVLTATIYNTDHTNHITNQNPSMTGAYSDSVGQMQAVVDPGGLGSEDLAASLAGELERLRFAIKRITGEAQWYIAPDSDLAALATGTFTQLILTGDLSPAQITASQDNYAPTGHAAAFRFRLNSDAARNITGLAGGTSGRVVNITNVGSFDLTIKDEDAASTAGNRFALDGDLVLEPEQSVALQYDNTSSRWRPKGAALTAAALLGLLVPRSLSIATQVITTPGANTYTPTAGMKYCLAISTGAGGGGGGADSDGSSTAAASGGGAGSTCIEVFDAATIGASQTVTIGAAGTAGADTGGNGGNGGDTTFGALHTAGGGPGGAGIAGTSEHITPPTAGGTASGGAANIPGGEGGPGWSENTAESTISGHGGGSLWGSGAGAVASNTTTVATAGRGGPTYGTGGSGALCRNDAAGAAGGAGAPGICVILELIYT